MIRDYVNTPLSASEIGDLLTMAGFELEGIEEVLGEPVLDVKVMSNRGDGLSVMGLSREILAKDLNSEPTDLYKRAVSRFENAASDMSNIASVTIESENCNRFACRYFDNAPNGPSPDWLSKRLEQAGQRSISFLVDLTNYVMLELGQPLHVFDFDKLTGGRIIVRQARTGETLKTLNGDVHELLAHNLLICDAEKPVSLAGVMGGLDSEVSATTTRVLLESAHFKNTSIRKTRKEHNLATEASYRFERSVDPDGVVAAIERFTELLGCQGSAILDVYPNSHLERVIDLHLDRAVRLLGMVITHQEAQGCLERLGMKVFGHGDPFSVIPPSWRPDLAREEDLIEELGRVHGYEKIPEALPKGTTTQGGLQEKIYRDDERLREASLRGGFDQLISYSLRDLHPLDRSDRDRVEPRNPASPEMAYLRDSLLPSLADAALRNGARNLHLFEIGAVFFQPQAGQFTERKHVAFLSTGDLIPPDRKGEAVPQANFFTLKGSLLSVSHEAGLDLQVIPPTKVDPRFHPGRQALVLATNKPVGVMGQIHPDIAAALKLSTETFLAEFDIREAFFEASKVVTWKAVSRNPAVGRDIALLVDRSVAYSEIEQILVRAGGELLERYWLFDVFAGAGIPEGKHSLGIGLSFRKIGANLNDEEANQARARIVEALAELGAIAR